MKKAFLLAMLAFVMSPAVSFAAASIGNAAPAFTLTDSAGEPRALEDFAGKKVILEWTNHDCPFVKKHYGSQNMQSLQSRYTEQGVVWLSIISSAKGKQGHVSAEQANALTQSRGAKPTYILFDESGEVGRAYGAKTTPHMYIIDEQGILKYNGAIDSISSANPADIAKAENYVDSAMAALAKGEPIQKTKTRPYGCSVKYAK